MVRNLYVADYLQRLASVHENQQDAGAVELTLVYQQLSGCPADPVMAVGVRDWLQADRSRISHGVTSNFR